MYLITNRAPAAEPHLKLVAEISPAPDAKFFLAEYYLRSESPRRCPGDAPADGG